MRNNTRKCEENNGKLSNISRCISFWGCKIGICARLCPFGRDVPTWPSAPCCCFCLFGRWVCRDEPPLGRQTEVRQACLPWVGMCSRFSTSGSLIYLQVEKWWELLTRWEALCITLFPHFSRSSLCCRFCVLMPTVLPEVLASVELSQSHNCKKICSRHSIRKGQKTPHLLHLPQHSVNCRIFLKSLLTIFATYSKIPKAIIIMN